MDVVRASGDVDRVECPADRGPEPCGIGAAVKGEAMSEEKISEVKKTTPVVAEAEIKMVLTTPFCPYGPMLIGQIQSVSETAAEMPVKVTVLPDRWEAPPWL